MSQSFSWEIFNRIPVVGILRNVAPRQIETLSSHYAKAGLTTLEITMNSKGAAKTISSLVEVYGSRLNIGAGTVCTLEDLDNALGAGAQFIVTPVVNEEIIKRCVANDVPVFAGAFTPTEIYKAWSLGASMVKVFPAGTLGPQYIKEVLAPLNQINLMPTGGITLENFTGFLKAGAKGLGMGSHLIPKHFIENNRWDDFSNHLSGFVQRFHEFQKATD